MTRLAPLGWRNVSPQAALAFLPPEPLRATDAGALMGMAPFLADGVDLARRIFVLRSPYNVRIRLVRQPGKPTMLKRIDEPGGLTATGFKAFVTPLNADAQRNPAVPTCQISMNTLFISDLPCTLHLLPPFFCPRFREWPGSIIAGRFPLRAWPRSLNCALEWHDQDRDWVLRRGDPMACVMPLYEEPDLVPDLFEARLTAPLKRHLLRVNDVSSFGRNVGPMFAEAERARPARLLERKIAPDQGTDRPEPTLR